MTLTVIEPVADIQIGEQAYAIAERIVAVLQRDDRLIGEMSPANMDGLAEDVERVLRGEQ